MAEEIHDHQREIRGDVLVLEVVYMVAGSPLIPSQVKHNRENISERRHESRAPSSFLGRFCFLGVCSVCYKTFTCAELPSGKFNSVNIKGYEVMKIKKTLRYFQG